jgi:hypothetical protein
LAWIYKCLLSAEVAKRNQLVLTTDQLEGYAAASGVDATQLALGGVDGRSVEGDLATAFGLIAMRVVVPRDLARVPIKKIISVRRRFGAQFDAWRDYVDRVGADLAEQLSDVESPTILRAYLDEAARKYAEAPVEQLRKGLASLGLDAADAALNTRFETPAALTAAGFASGQPIAVAAGVAAGITELRRRTKGKAQAQLASPNAYLLNVKATLEPRSWLERVAASMRKAAGLRA